MSEWINIDKLGTVGIELDRVQTATDPQSFTDAVNVRPVGPNLQNAGGYKVVTDYPAIVTTRYILSEARDSLPTNERRVTRYILSELLDNPTKTERRVTRFILSEARQSSEY